MATETTAPAKGNIFKKILLYIFGFLLLASVISYFVCSFNYREGNYAGVVINFSREGVIFKTYEGELNLGAAGNVPNTAQMNQAWKFSVNNEATAQKIILSQGKKVALHYNEVVKAFFWQGQTNFFVDSVRVIE